jgi:hypothetical protein
MVTGITTYQMELKREKKQEYIGGLKQVNVLEKNELRGRGN